MQKRMMKRAISNPTTDLLPKACLFAPFLHMDTYTWLSTLTLFPADFILNR